MKYEAVPSLSAVSRRMLKKSASSVLASLRGSTYRSVRLASSLAAALLGSFLSLLCDVFLVSLNLQSNEVLACTQSFPQPARLFVIVSCDVLRKAASDSEDSR